MERQEGYYWVKWRGEFMICEWWHVAWYIHGTSVSSDDDDFEYINEERINPPSNMILNDL